MSSTRKRVREFFSYSTTCVIFEFNLYDLSVVILYSYLYVNTLKWLRFILQPIFRAFDIALLPYEKLLFSSFFFLYDRFTRLKSRDKKYEQLPTYSRYLLKLPFAFDDCIDSFYSPWSKNSYPLRRNRLKWYSTTI